MGRCVAIETDIARLSFRPDALELGSLSGNLDNNEVTEIDLELERIGKFIRFLRTPQNDSTISSDIFVHGSPYEREDHPDWHNVENANAKILSSKENRFNYDGNSEVLSLTGGELIFSGLIFSPYPNLFRVVKNSLSFDLSSIRPRIDSLVDSVLSPELETTINKDQITQFTLREKGKYIGFVIFNSNEHITNIDKARELQQSSI